MPSRKEGCFNRGRECMVVSALSIGSSFSIIAFTFWIILLTHFSSSGFKDQMQCRGDALLKGWGASCEKRGHTVTVDEDDNRPKPPKRGSKPTDKLEDWVPALVRPPTAGATAFVELRLNFPKKIKEPTLITMDFARGMKPEVCGPIISSQAVFVQGPEALKTVKLSRGLPSGVGVGDSLAQGGAHHHHQGAKPHRRRRTSRLHRLVC
eukprot:Platyproteum_vivax@DN2673_c0_g1_i3.p1